MYKVLVCGLANEKDQGGIESMVLNYYKRFDTSKIHFDFICNSDKYKMAYADQFENLGSRIFYTPKRGSHPIKYYQGLNKLFLDKHEDYDCLWLNTSDLANIAYLKLARKYHIKRIIVHSHNSKLIVLGLKGRIYQKLHELHRKNIKKYATDYWACSKEAADWMFPKDIKSEIIKNAIDLNSTKLDKEKRKGLREKYNLQDTYVIGNVGRLNFQKNQEFLIKIANELKKKKINFKIIVVGQGEEKENLKRLITQLNVSNNVMLVGQQNDMQAWYSAFDLFLFPSRFEGLSVSLLEAQANGVPILASDRVSPNEIKINDNIKFMSLSEDPKVWAEKILKQFIKSKRENEQKINKNFNLKGYNIDMEAPKLANKFID
ncbi:MAG: glycosyltransferase [Lactobacillus johnsonii]|nr:glycosyltransferase [Lactobacillus johnsonii]MDY4728899.1 glycosyltransferase [Lactobacillus amylovorus]